MSWERIKVCLALVIALVLVPLAAEDSVFIGDGDIGGVRIYDSQGSPLETNMEVASNIEEGWIIYNPDSPILIITPKGSINLFEESILITGDLISANPSLYLVQGKATFQTHDMGEGTLSVSTPVSLFKLTGDGEMFVITDDVEESVTVFKGKATSYNSITRATRTIESFQKLAMSDSRAQAKPIATGYYLTYATYPDLMLAKQLISDMAESETPPVPKFSSVLLKPEIAETPKLAKGVIILPSEAPSFDHVQVEEARTPPKPYTISVTSVPVKLPTIPQTLTALRIPRLMNRIIVTVRPSVPQAPTTVEATTKAISIPPAPFSIQPKILPGPPSDVTSLTKVLPASPSLVTVSSTEPEVMAEPVVQGLGIEPVTEEPETAEALESAAKKEIPKAMLSTQEEVVKAGSVGLQASYNFLFDGTASNTLTNTIALKPYLTYKSFALTLQASVSTDDFSLFTSNVTPFPSGALERVSYGFKYVSSLRFGYASSPFFIALDNKRYHSPLAVQFMAPVFGESSKLSLYNRVEFGSFSRHLYFDDLYFSNLLENVAGNYQVGSFIMEYAKSESYAFAVSLGTLVKIENFPGWDVDLYPHLDLLFPLIDVRTTQLSLLISLSGYLPVYPNFKPEDFIDVSLSSLFPNYQVSAGFSLDQGAFSAKVLGSFREGENRNLLSSDLAHAFDTSYDSVFDLFAETLFAGEHFNVRLAVNLPFASDLSIATLTSSSDKADFSQFTLSYKQKSFTFSFGMQEVGIADTIKSILDGSQQFTTLFGGARATSFLSAGYSLKDLNVKVKASYPASPTLYTTPKISITASYKVGMQF